MGSPERPAWPGRAVRIGGGAAAIVAAVVVVIALISSSGASHRSPPLPGSPPTEAPTTPPAPVPAGPPARQAPSGEQFGVSVNRLFNDRNSARQINAQLNALRRTGVTLARTDAFWEAAEPQPPVAGVHRYHWAFDDLIARSLATHRLRWVAIIDYSAPWAQSSPGKDHSPPRYPAAYAAYAGAFAARYGPGGSFWTAHPHLPAEPVETYEIWNEPDNPEFWTSSSGAARYVELYLQARAAVTAADPSARVIVGGLTNPRVYLPAMLAARPDLRGHLDGVAIHPYGPGPRAVLANVATARATLDSLGMGSVPLYVTEFGWTTSPPGAQDWAPAAARPTYIAQTLAALGHLNCGLAAAILYTWVTPERDPRNKEDWFGIHSPQGGGSNDSAAFVKGLQAARRSAPDLNVCQPG